MTDVVDGPRGANAGAARKDEEESFSTVTVGNPEVDHPGWVLDDLLSAGGQSGSADNPDAQALTQTRAIAEYYEMVAAASGDPKAAANWVMGDLSGALNAVGKDFGESPVSAQNLGELVGLIRKQDFSRSKP